MGAPISRDEIEERLSFADRRLDELLRLNDGHLAGADGSERQQLLQEFFFHLVGATEVLAQFVNEARDLGMDSEDVSVPQVARKLAVPDPIRAKLGSLHMRTKGRPLPADHYSDDTLVFRILNYRHQVTHRRNNPFLFRVGSEPPASFFLDPRNRKLGASSRSAQDEMHHMFRLIRGRCREVLAGL